MKKLEKFFKGNLYEKKGTITAYTAHINKYFEVIGKDIETYFDDVPPYNTQDPEQLKAYNLHYEQDLMAYWEYLQHKAPKTKQSSIAAVKQFLRYYDKQTINLDIWGTIQTRMKGKLKAISEEHVPEIPEIKRILEYCDIKTKTAIIIATSSGMRIGEVMRLEPQDIHLNETPTRINVRAEISKNGQRRTTFISTEATEILKEWLRVRDDYIQDAYKSLNFKNAQHVKKNKQNDKRVFPFDPSVIQRAFNDASEMAGFTDMNPMNGDDGKKKRQRRTLHYHNLRKFFRSNFGNVDLAEHLMGHSGYLSEYRNFSDKRLAEEYLKNQHNLLVYEVSPDLSGINESLKEKDLQMKKMQETIDELSEFKKKYLEQLIMKHEEQINGKKKK